MVKEIIPFGYAHVLTCVDGSSLCRREVNPKCPDYGAMLTMQHYWSNLVET